MFSGDDTAKKSKSTFRWRKNKISNAKTIVKGDMKKAKPKLC